MAVASRSLQGGCCHCHQSRFTFIPSYQKETHTFTATGRSSSDKLANVKGSITLLHCETGGVYLSAASH